MCGINGFNWENRELIKEMGRLTHHRGPDQQGTYTDRHISLGHQRLSIIDLSEAGKQPMENEDGTLQLIFVGEIYNYKPLRAKLLEKGHKFRSNTDTEVIIHAYEEYGFDCVKLLEGMFTFAVYDTKKRILFIARDRLGIKPLYYYHNKDKFIFSSEIKAILAHDIPRVLSPNALHDYLSFRSVTTEETMIQGIKKLQPGHFLVFYNYESMDKEKAYKAIIKKYWSLGYQESKISEDQAASEVKDLMQQSVKDRLMSDVPRGVFLSGGLDSGAIVSLMHQAVEEPINTFSVGFGIEDHKDELGKAKYIAEHFETNHHEIIVKPDAASILPSLVWHMDEPMCDPTSIPTWYLAQHTKPKSTVVLTGEGADEVYGGYVQYKIMLLHQKYIRYRSQFLRDSAYKVAKVTPINILNKFFKYTEGLGKKGFDRFSHFLRTNDYGEQYLDLVSIFSEDEKRSLLDEQYKFTIEQQQLVSRMNAFLHQKGALLNNMLNLETHSVLVDNLLMKVDKNTMAHSIEARVPFLDHKVVEHAASLPARYKLKGKTEKYILRKAMQGIVPDATREQKKERFFVPIQHWFGGELKELTKQLLSESNVRKAGVFNPDYIQKVFRGFNDSKIFYGRQLWSLMIFELWRKMYLEPDQNWKKPSKPLKEFI